MVRKPTFYVNQWLVIEMARLIIYIPRSGSSLVKKYGNPDQSTICTFFFHTFPFFHHISTIMVLLFPHGSFPYLCILCCCGYLWNPIQSSDPDASVVSKIHLMICLLWHWVYHILYIHITHIYINAYIHTYIYINTYIYITYIYMLCHQAR